MKKVAKLILISAATTALVLANEAPELINSAENSLNDGSDGDWDPNWNYDKNGADWNFTNCNNTKQT